MVTGSLTSGKGRLEMQHRFKTSYGQCRCLWCNGRGVDCPVTEDIRAAIKAWAAKHGRTWKQALRDAWESGDYGSFPFDAELQRYRNTCGPSALAKVTPRMVAA